MVIKLTNNNINDTFFAIAGNNAGWKTTDGNDDELYLYNGSRIVKLTNNNRNNDNFQDISARYALWESNTGRTYDEFFAYNGRRIIRLTNNNRPELFGEVLDGAYGIISGRYITWQSYSNPNDLDSPSPDVEIFDGTQIIQATNNGSGSFEDSSDKYVVWEDSGELYLYDGIREVRLTNNNEIEIFEYTENIFGNFVVWEAGSEIFVYDGDRVIQLSNSNRPGDNDFQGVSARYVVWTGDRDNDTDSELYLYNGIRTIQLANDEGSSDSEFIRFIGVSNTYVVWSGRDNGGVSGLFAYNGRRVIKLTNDELFNSDTLQGISNRYITWTDGDDGQLYLYDNRNIVQLTTNVTVSDDYKGIYGNLVVWTGNDGNDDEMFVYNGIRPIRLTNNRTFDTFLASDNGYVVWQGNDGVDRELYAYRGGRTIKLTNNRNNFDRFGGIFGDTIYWTSNDGTDSEIYVYNGRRTIQVTNNRTNDIEPVVSGNNVFWQTFDGRDYELYTERLSNLVSNISINNTLAIEGLNNIALFSVTLSRASTTPITLNYTTRNQTASVGSDYRFKSGTITFRAGQLRQFIRIPLLNNNRNEVSETFRVILSKANPSDAVLRKAVGIATITDTLRSSISRSLPFGVENLTLTGRAIGGVGNASNNDITGNNTNNRLFGLAGNDTLLGLAGNDILNGGVGRDILTGGRGRDRFVFNSRNERGDRITDFLPVADTISISARGFGGGLRRGVLPVAQFRTGIGAVDANDRFIYNRATGVLSFDADGNGAIARVAIAILDTGLTMTNADIVVTF